MNPNAKIFVPSKTSIILRPSKPTRPSKPSLKSKPSLPDVLDQLHALSTSVAEFVITPITHKQLEANLRSRRL